MELTDCRVLLKRLKYPYHTKGPREIRRTGAEDIKNSILSNTGQGGAGHDMEPTNNHSEKAMRCVVDHRNVRMQYAEVQYAVDVHRYAAVARHLDIPRAAAAHCRGNLGEFMLSLNIYAKTRARQRTFKTDACVTERPASDPEPAERAAGGPTGSTWRQQSVCRTTYVRHCQYHRTVRRGRCAPVQNMHQYYNKIREHPVSGGNLLIFSNVGLQFCADAYWSDNLKTTPAGATSQ